MLISLDKNKWLYDWMHDKWHEEITYIIFNDKLKVPRPNELRKELNRLLISKGYTSKLTSKFDIIISFKESEFIYLKLKYS